MQRFVDGLSEFASKALARDATTFEHGADSHQSGLRAEKRWQRGAPCGGGAKWADEQSRSAGVVRQFHFAENGSTTP
jgi:hypothetical protein